MKSSTVLLVLLALTFLLNLYSVLANGAETNQKALIAGGSTAFGMTLLLALVLKAKQVK
ncbi:hypothetical protein [Larkinella terrae]|uniref:Uncharacterized protein n=1 Tax=Larkinella terrae TaxID=2025311 RepID=A0A7K0EJG6_9BACT|nr:hypothetical protein [Larkinella terrae]MRS61934.1 hypothetical protein [Larkinella terrae]